MSKNKSHDEAAELAAAVVEAMQEIKGHDIVVMQLSNIHSAICDYFVICHGDSTTQVEALGDSVEFEVKKKLGERPWHKEGFANAEWILLDYVDVVVHVFHKEAREFYGLEKLWADAEIKRYKDVG